MHNSPKDVPFIAHEAALARMERQARRLWVLVSALAGIIMMLAGGIRIKK